MRKIKAAYLTKFFTLVVTALILASCMPAGFSKREAEPPSPADKLVAAAKKGDIAAVQGLIAGVIDVNQPDRQKKLALVAASGRGHIEVAAALMKAGARIDDSGYHPETALRAASGSGHEALVQMFIDAGADIEAKDSLGWTPLLGAARSGFADVCERLLDAGADINAADKDGRQVLHLLTMMPKDRDPKAVGETNMARFLIGRDADVNAKSDDAKTPLHLASAAGLRPLAKLFINNAADVNAETGYGVRPLDMAQAMGHREVADLLKGNGAETGSYRSLDTKNCPPSWRHVYPGMSKYDFQSLTGLKLVGFSMIPGSNFGVPTVIKLRGADITADPKGNVTDLKCY